MKSIDEKMRQMGTRLKSAGELMRRSAASGVSDAASVLRKARQMPSEWRASRRPIATPSVVDGWSAVTEAAAAPMPGHAAPLGSAETRWKDRNPGIARLLTYAFIALVLFLAVPYPLMLIYRFVDPPISAMMLRNVLLGRGLEQSWVDFQDISPNLAQAVVISEDAAFCRHSGVDWNAVGEALDDLEDGDKPRGASTLPMQTAKNLFLWPGQSYVRKALEVPLAYFMSFVWPKQRILEVYLNVAEWGPGIYGAEAAAQHHFGVSAASLTPGEAALLAASLPSPIKRNAGRPSARVLSIANRIQGRVNREAADAACVFDR
jgi:monofunctional biosynthetic peptidoglycan transglycosylase